LIITTSTTYYGESIAMFLLIYNDQTFASQHHVGLTYGHNIKI